VRLLLLALVFPSRADLYSETEVEAPHEPLATEAASRI
jgi:hypothetical protein